ncbi:glycoside hydrolase family 5 protein [Aquella oligotrophica]|uniref:Glycoside hydrolase family 5 domain-containing protein n=1 Tax=Aquella oligotrophica TaxID=2067065 RepID=A0A2I7N606_9NEIS|nr:cellulase family glycosylhydrolase [Aquella oligotrophica]AUR51889.1 hypothetical protein CUN60_06120 [Aquella oligotrophica]
MTHKYKKICLLLGISSLSLTACQSGSSAGGASGSSTSSDAQQVVKSFADVAQYSTPSASCIIVAGQQFSASSDNIGGFVTLKNGCEANQTLDQTKVYMSSSKSDLNPSLFNLWDLEQSSTLIVPMPGWEEHWVSASMAAAQIANASSGYKDLELTLSTANKAAYLLPGGTTRLNFGYSPNGVNPGTVTFSTTSTATPETPGTIVLTLNTKPLSTICVAPTSCSIPVHLLGQNGNFDQVIDVIDNSKANNTIKYTIKDMKSSDYRFAVNSKDLPQNESYTVGFTASALFNLTSGATINESAAFTKVKVSTGNVTYQIIKPSTFISQYTTTQVDLKNSITSYSSTHNYTSDQFTKVEKGTYTLSTPYGLADAKLGTYANPIKKGSIKVTAANTTDIGSVSYVAKASNANVKVNVSGLANGETLGVKLTDNLAGVSYLYNDITLNEGVNTLKLLQNDNIVLNVNTPTGYKAVAPISYSVVKNGEISINLEKIESEPVIIPPGGVAFNNNSSFYLHLQNNAPNAGCPTTVKPGEHTYAMINKGSGWANSCYYLVCSSKDYQDGPGCLEKTPEGTMNQGGYIAWINLNPETHACALPGYDSGTNTFACSMDASGNFKVDFKSKVQTYSAGQNVNKPVTLPTIPTSYKTAPGLQYRGINISGYEYNGTIGDAMFQRPDLPEFKSFAEKGMNTLRLPIRWEYLIADNKPGYNNLISSTTLDPAKSHINEMYLAGLRDTISKYLNANVNVIIDMHTYLRYCKAGNNEDLSIGQTNEPTEPVGKTTCNIVTAKEFADTWKTLAIALQDIASQHGTDKSGKAQLMFSLANEPFSQKDQYLTTQEVFDIEVAGAKEIQVLGLKNRIIFSGNFWDPLHGWPTFVPTDDAVKPNDQANGVVFTKANLEKAGINVKDIAIEVHQYFDSNYSGKYEQCNVYSNYENFVQALDLSTMGKWMNDNEMQVMLSEFGAADNPTCQTDLEYMFRYLEEHALGQPGQEKGGFTGWQLWRANRHNNGGYGAFSYLDKEDYTVYGGNGSKPAIPDGTGILRGPANGLMDSLYFHHLTH